MNTIIKERKVKSLSLPKKLPINSKSRKTKSLSTSYSKLIIDDSYYKSKIIENKLKKERIQYIYSKYGNIFINILNKIKRNNINKFIEERIKIYNKFKQQFGNNINKCFNNNNSLRYNIDNQIFINNRLGTATKSAFSKIFIGKIKYNSTEKDIIIKFQDSSKEATNEFKILEILSNNIDKCPNFPILYININCFEGLENYIPLYDKESYNAIITEVAQGDLKIFTMNITDDDLFINAFEQIMMTLLFFNTLTNYCHDDSHLGNFLYFKINPGGYLHYRINGEDYYIKNLGYLWIIWDFGISKTKYTIIKEKKRKIVDIERITNILISTNIGFKFQMMLNNFKANCIDNINDYKTLVDNIQYVPDFFKYKPDIKNSNNKIYELTI